MPRISAAEFMEIQTPDTIRLELDDGALVVLPHHTWEHQHALQQLLIILELWVSKRDLGVVLHEMDVWLDEDCVRTPDLVYLTKKQIPLIANNYIDGAPALVSECLSLPPEDVDRGKKKEQYAAAGIPEYWIVDTRKRMLEAFVNTGGQYALRESHAGSATFRPSLFPGLEIPLARLWLKRPQ